MASGSASIMSCPVAEVVGLPSGREGGLVEGLQAGHRRVGVADVDLAESRERARIEGRRLDLATKREVGQPGTDVGAQLGIPQAPLLQEGVRRGQVPAFAVLSAWRR